VAESGAPGSAFAGPLPPRGLRRPAPAPVPWRVWEALALLAFFGASQLAAGLGLGFLARTWGGPDTEPSAAPLLIAVVLVSHGLGWTALRGLLVWRHGLGFAAALALRRVPARTLLRTYGLGLAVYLAALTPAALFPPPPEHSNLFLEIFRQGGATLAVLFAVAVLLAPPIEEALFRGVLFPALRRRLAFLPAALVTTALFTALHVTQTGAYWPAIAAIFICGLALAWLRERTGNLWQPIVFHMGFNSVPFLVWLAALPFGGIG